MNEQVKGHSDSVTDLLGNNSLLPRVLEGQKELIKVRKQVIAASRVPSAASVAETASISPMIINRFSDAIAVAASHRFDTTRTCAQYAVLLKYTTKERKFLKWNKPCMRLERWTVITLYILLKMVIYCWPCCQIPTSE